MVSAPTRRTPETYTSMTRYGALHAANAGEDVESPSEDVAWTRRRGRHWLDLALEEESEGAPDV